MTRFYLVLAVVVLCQTCLCAQDILRKVLSKSCSSSYTMGCFKMDMVQLVNILDDNQRFTLFPGVDITRDNNTEEKIAKKLPEKLVRSLARSFPDGNSSDLDDYLVARVSQYLGSHSLSLSFGEDSNSGSASSQQNLTHPAGRKGGGGGKGGYGGVIAAAMMMKGMLATLGMGALAALAGKALMTGLMSLMLSAIIGLKSASSGGGHKSTTYEIISKPVYSHSHSASSEVQHDHGHGGGGGGGHAAYTYGRNLDYKDGKKEDKVTRTSEVQYLTLGENNENDDAEQIEYKTISEDDLKQMQQYGSYYANNLDYGALAGGVNAHGPAAGAYRGAKTLETPQQLLVQPSMSTTPTSR